MYDLVFVIKQFVETFSWIRSNSVSLPMPVLHRPRRVALALDGGRRLGGTAAPNAAISAAVSRILAAYALASRCPALPAPGKGC